MPVYLILFFNRLVAPWGRQSCLPPAFSRRGRLRNTRKPPEKAVAGKIACTTLFA
jgi:hypothetical protein